MSNKKKIKNALPDAVFMYRQALVNDFFAFYEMRYKDVSVMKLVKKNLPKKTPTAEQMASVLMSARIYWKNYIDTYKLPSTLYKTLEQQIKIKWQSMERRFADATRQTSHQSKTQ